MWSVKRTEQDKYFFKKNRAENEVGKLVPDLFLFIKTALHEVKGSGLLLSFDIFRLPSTLYTIKTNYIKLSSTYRPYVVYDFSREMFSMLYSINWPNFIIWFPLANPRKLVNMCIAIIYFPGCDVIKFKINLSFQIN